MDTRSQFILENKPDIKDYISPVEPHLNVEDIFNDLKLFGNQSKSWEWLHFLTEMTELNRQRLKGLSSALTQLKEQHAKKTLPADVKSKITSLDEYISKESERLFFSPAIIFMPYAHVFIQRRINANLRHYAFDVFLHALKSAAADIFKQCIDPMDENDRSQAIRDFNEMFKSINVDFKENHLNLSRAILSQDEHLESKIQALLGNAQRIVYKTWTNTTNARAILEDHLVKAHKAIELDYKAYFGSDQQAFNDFWGVQGPFTIIANTKYIGWSNPLFAWNWGSGLDRLDYISRGMVDSAHANRVTYTSQAVIDSCLTEEITDYFAKLALEIPKSAVEREGQKLGFLPVLEEKTTELASLSGKLDKLPISQFVGATLFPAAPICPPGQPILVPAQLKK